MYIECTTGMELFDTRAMVRHFGSVGMSCHKRSHMLATELLRKK
jgi:hypothetical protein